MAAADHRDAGDPGGWRKSGPRGRRPRHADPGGVKVINLKPASRQTSDRAHAWLRGAMTALAILAVAAAASRCELQYVLVHALNHATTVAALEPSTPAARAAPVGTRTVPHDPRPPGRSPGPPTPRRPSIVRPTAPAPAG